MSKRPALCAILLAAAAWPSASMGLTPQEVVIVANAGSPDSVGLAKFYAKARGIDETNIAWVKTTTAYEVTRSGYNTQILQPLKRFLLQANRRRSVRCLCLMWGVPVRIAAGGGGQTAKVYRTAATRAHYRLAVNYKLLASVAKTFPQPKTNALRPVGALFGKSVPAPTEPPTKTGALRQDISRLMARKRVDVAKITDAAKRRIASRQLMALTLDIYGTQGLIDFITDSRPDGAPEVEDLKRRLAEAERRLTALARAKPTAEGVKATLALLPETGGQVLLWSYAQKRTERIEPPKADAAVDSELALLWWGQYKLGGPFPNPLNWNPRQRAGALSVSGRKVAPETLMTARIDGPTRADAMRMIKASLATEKDGLKGIFYIDAGGTTPAYDVHLERLYGLVKAKTKLNVVIDRSKAVFARGRCPQAALYVGWYSLKRYVPAFMWKPGAVGWHIASFEAMHLRDPNSQEWCVKMIQNGVAATVGAVNEPYLGAFPLPEQFFPLLLTGKWTIAECYWRTVPWASWRMTLIADPLYSPFKAAGRLDPDILPKALTPP